MSATDHLATAREYIAKGDEFYAKAGQEILAAFDDGTSYAEIARYLDRSKDWVRRLADGARASQTEGGFHIDWQSGSNKRDDVAAKVLSDPEQRKQVLASLPADQIEEVIQEAQDVAVERVRAQRAEHQTAPTTRDLMGGDKFNPAEYWADTLVIRLNRNARELASLIDRAGGLLFGTMPPEEAFDYLHESERLIAEARAAAQEQVRDRTAGV